MAMILFQLPSPAYSQRFLIGVKVAGQITNTFTYPALPETVHEDRVLFGLMGEAHLVRHLSLEANVLYKPKLDYTSHYVSGYFPFPVLQTTDDLRAHSWQVPILLKLHPIAQHDKSLFIAGGVSSRNVAGIEHVFGTVTGGIPPLAANGPAFDMRTADGVMVNHWTFGPVIAAGVDFRAGKFHFQPELRYTRWNASPFSYITKQDNVQALIGIVVGK